MCSCWQEDGGVGGGGGKQQRQQTILTAIASPVFLPAFTPRIIHACVSDPANPPQIAVNDSRTQLGYCGVPLSLIYLCLQPAIKAEADLGVQLLQTGTGENNRGHKQWHVTLLPTELAALIEEILKEALHLYRALKVQQALPCVVLLTPTCASFLHSPRHCTCVMQVHVNFGILKQA